MSQLSPFLRDWTDGAGKRGLTYWCQGCEAYHQIWVEGGDINRNWGWNGDVDRPTFTPSVLVTYPANPDADEEFKEWRTERRCHTFITDGQVQFLGDCTHAMAGKTLPLPPLPGAAP